MEIDYNPKNETWVINATVRDTYDIKEIPGARASRKMAPEEARWTVPATIGSAYQIAADLPQAEWTDAALDFRGELAETRKMRMRAKTRRFDNLERAMERYEHAPTIDSQALRYVRAGLLPVEGDKSVLLPHLQGGEPHPGGAEPSGAEGGGQESRATGGPRRGGDVPEATRTTRAPGRSGADARPTPAAGRGRAPREREQTGQPTEQPVGVRKPGGARALSPMQVAGVAHLLGGSGVLADDMGSGKSVMSSVAVALLGSRTVLVLTTMSTLNVWAEHLREWAGIEPFIFHGPSRARVYAEYLAFEGPKALISTHALMQKHSARASFGHVAADGEAGEFNEDFELCILDEAHKAGLDPKRPGLRALHRIGHNCGVRWALTGTPVNTSPDEMWNLMAFVEPTVLMDRGAFRRRLCIMVDRGFGSPINEGIHPDRIEEYDFLVQPYFLRRLKREVWADLPAALPPQYIRLPLTDKQAALYRKVVKEGVARIDTGVITAVDDLALTQVCQYIACGMPEVGEDGRVTALAGPSNKLVYLLEMMEERGRDNPIVVYSYSTKVTALLEAGLVKAGWRVNTIDGSTPRKMRDAIVKAFQAYSLDVLLITDAGAEGLTLTAADTIVFAMESWSARTNQQVRDRIDRIGQTKETSTIVLVSEGTVEESRRRSVADKVDRQQLVLRDKVELSSFLNGTM